MLMKKILLLVIFLLMCTINSFGQFNFYGCEGDFTEGKTCEYECQGVTSESHQITWTLTNGYGVFISSDGSQTFGNPLTTVGPPSRVTVRWGKLGNATLNVKVEKNNKVVASKTWNIKIKQYSPPNPSTGTNYIIRGKQILNVGDIETYTIGDNQKVSSWEVNPEHFEIIEETKRTIKLKAIKHATDTYVKGVISSTAQGMTYIDINPVYKIKNLDTNIICSNNTVSYTIEGFDLTPGATVYWIADNLMTLISGQESPTATFNGVGNGQGIVKAIVRFKGLAHEIENSDVWVGAPPVPQSIIGFVPNSTDPREMQVVPGQSYSFNLPEEKSTTGGQWTVKSLAQIEIPYRQWVGGKGVFVDIPNMQPNGMIYMINLSASNKNKCGVSSPISRFLILGANDPRNRILMKTQGIESALSEPQPTSIRIYSYLTGSLVYQKKNTISFDIQSTNLGEGIYILEMTDQQGNVTREKVMKGKQ